jgi:excisionase family DNA binding protein
MGAFSMNRAIGTEGEPIQPISVRVPDAVRITGLSRSRLYELMRDGEVEFVKVGSSTLVLTASLHAFIDSKRK